MRRAIYVDPLGVPFDELLSEFDRCRRPQRDPAEEFRRKYWADVPPGEIAGEEAVRHLREYATAIETTFSEIISQRSLLYWLHAYRQFPPWLTSTNGSRAYNARAGLENAFQKYASHAMGPGLAWSNEINPQHILKGRFVKRASPQFVDQVRESRVLVLTDFDVEELGELHRLDRLGLELYRAGAATRAVATGCHLFVEADGSGFMRPPEPSLRKAMETQTRRIRGLFEASSTATVVDRASTGGAVAALNVGARTELLNWWTKRFGPQDLEFTRPMSYQWTPFPFKSYYDNHRGFESDFASARGCTLLATLQVFLGLVVYAMRSWGNGVHFARCWTVALEAGLSRSAITDAVMWAMPAVGPAFGGSSSTRQEVDAAIDLLTLTADKRSDQEPFLGGPMSAVLPTGDQYTIDFGWMPRILDTLFYGVTTENQNFKAGALEQLLVRDVGNEFPQRQCVAHDGSSREIDASFIRGAVLVLVECKANGKSLAYERGNLQAVKSRQHLVEKAIDEARDKADWLAKRPTGTNYAVPAGVKFICPIAVTPFPEFVPPIVKFWLTEELPRVLTPAELVEAAKGVSLIRFRGRFNYAA